jgi:hypothetical protein
MVGIQDAINVMGEGANYLINPIIDNAINPVIGGINQIPGRFSLGAVDISPFGDGIYSLGEIKLFDKPNLKKTGRNVVPSVDFGTKWDKYVPEPEDLFWAGKRKQNPPMPNGSICQFTCKQAGFQSGLQDASGNCLCTSQVPILHSNSLDSCADVCTAVGGISNTPNPSSTCGNCVNEIVLTQAANTLSYSFACYQVPTSYTPPSGTTFFSPDKSNQLKSYISDIIFPTMDYCDSVNIIFIGVFLFINIL